MKWSKDHKCSPEVLNAVEILWESLLDEDDQFAQAIAETSTSPVSSCVWLCLRLHRVVLLLRV
jgi:hypothetical protein